MSALPIEDTFEQIVEQEDIEIPCECLWHTEVRGPAEWAIHRTQWCCQGPKVILVCAACLVEILNHEGPIRCRVCDTTWDNPPRHYITYYERLNP